MKLNRKYLMVAAPLAGIIALFLATSPAQAGDPLKFIPNEPVVVNTTPTVCERAFCPTTTKCGTTLMLRRGDSLVFDNQCKQSTPPTSQPPNEPPVSEPPSEPPVEPPHNPNPPNCQPKDKKPNAGRGNGSEGSPDQDPAQSSGRNRGGD